MKCLIIDRFIKPYRFIVDTGAKYMCCPYESIDLSLTEQQLSGNKTKYVGGFVKGDVVKFYEYEINQFTIGSIDMGTQDIWITFDKRVTDAVLGMDLLKKIIMITNLYDQKIYFCKDAEDYKQNFRLEFA